MRLIPMMMSVAAFAAVACSGENGGNLAMNEADGNAAAMAADPANPFGQIEMEMNRRMSAATGANASETWVRKMIEHHRGAVHMSELLVRGGGDPRFVEMARTDIQKQQREIRELERMLAGGISGGSGEANPYRAVEENMHRQMMAATGSDISETWARKMIAHHRGAVDMSQVLIGLGGNPQVVALARRTAEEQAREADHLEAMLRGEAMPSAAEPATVASEPSADAERRPEAEAKPAPAARSSDRDRAAPQPPVTPTPPEEPEPACAPEHRAAGHC